MTCNDCTCTNSVRIQINCSVRAFGPVGGAESAPVATPKISIKEAVMIFQASLSVFQRLELLFLDNGSRIMVILSHHDIPVVFPILLSYSVQSVSLAS